MEASTKEEDKKDMKNTKTMKQKIIELIKIKNEFKTSTIAMIII